MWGCQHKDDVRDYACCPVLWDFATRRLRLSAPSTPAEQRECFFGLSRCWHRRDFHLAVRQAILVYVAYKAHVTWRAKKGTSPAPHGLLRQGLAEACRGDPGISKLLDELWLR